MTDTPCTERQRVADVADPYGNTVWKTTVPMEHDWRLFTREPTHDVEDLRRSDGVVVGAAFSATGLYKEFWYCTKCRFEEERLVK